MLPVPITIGIILFGFCCVAHLCFLNTVQLLLSHAKAQRKLGVFAPLRDMYLLIKELNVQECDATKAHSSTKVGHTIIFQLITYDLELTIHSTLNPFRVRINFHHVRRVAPAATNILSLRDNSFSSRN